MAGDVFNEVKGDGLSQRQVENIFTQPLVKGHAKDQL